MTVSRSSASHSGREEMELSNLIIRTKSCLSFGERRELAVVDDSPSERSWPRIISIVIRTWSIEKLFLWRSVFRNLLKTCFQSKSQVKPSCPQRRLKRGSCERVSNNLLPSGNFSQRVCLIRAAHLCESPSDTMQYNLLSSSRLERSAVEADRRRRCWSFTVSRLQLPLMTKGFAAYSDGIPDKTEAAMTVALLSISKCPQ